MGQRIRIMNAAQGALANSVNGQSVNGQNVKVESVIDRGKEMSLS